MQWAIEYVCGVNITLIMCHWEHISYSKEKSSFWKVQKEGEINYKPYKTTVAVKSENGLNQITEFSSGDEGSFKVYLKPGRFVLELQKTSNSFPILIYKNLLLDPLNINKIIARFFSPGNSYLPKSKDFK